MKNRLQIARDFLKDDGSIFISIDNNELAYLQVLMDDIFGKANRKNVITVKRSAISGAKVINPGVVNISEYLIVYSKNFVDWQVNRVLRKKGRDERYNNFVVNFNDKSEKWKFSSVLDAWANALRIDKQKIKKHFGETYEEELEKFYFNNANRIMQFVSLDDNAVADEVVKIKYKSKDDTSKVYHLKRDNGKADYYIFNGKAILFLSNRLTEIDGQKVFAEPITDIWDDVLPNDLHNEGGVKLKKGKKPEKLVQRIIELTTKEGDLVLDYHLGSGTTAAVAHKMGRRYIGIEQLDYDKDGCSIRLKNTIKGEQSGISKAVNWKGGGSFVYMELKQWNEQYIQAIQEAKTVKELTAIYKKMQAEAFFRYEIDLSKFEQKQFGQMTSDEQKKVLLECLDKNHLYVNYNEMEDATYKIPAEEKKINKQFYS
jgi:adenine-specific DNA-methyltransferase